MTAPSALPYGDRTRRLVRGGLLVGSIGLLLLALGVVARPRQAFFSYLAVYAAVLGTVLGALILVMMSHVTGAKWFVVLRRITEMVAATLPLLAVLFIPILFGLRELYPWISPNSLDAAARGRILQKHAYLNVPYFVVRAVV